MLGCTRHTVTYRHSYALGVQNDRIDLAAFGAEWADRLLAMMRAQVRGLPP